MRDVERIWGAWKSGVYVGDTRPSTRLTVEKGWSLQVADQVGTWTRGPARWFQRADTSKQIETEVPNLVSVNITRSVDSDVGSCDLVIQNTVTPLYGQPETPAGQFGDIGHFTWDHGTGQEAKARWGHVSNPWSEVLVPNALLRTYVGFGGTDLPVDQAVAAGFLVLYGVWLVDEVTIQTDGTLALRCRDIGKLLVDQQLFPPMMPTNLYPLDYHRWVIKTTDLPGESAPPGDYCYAGYYWNSSTDEFYGEWITRATGHPGTDAFDNSTETGVPDVPGAYAHQRTYWLSEPKDDPNDTVWIEFNVNGGEAGIINQIYYHAWKGAIEGHGVHRIMVSVWENGTWVSPETDEGGITPQGIPYVCTFVPGTEIAPAVASNLYNLPRDYRSTLIRLTVTSLIWADDFPYGFGDPDPHNGYRAGARKIMACFSAKNGDVRIPPLTYACAAIPANKENRIGYWQIKANGQLFAFGDARVQPVTSPSSAPASTVVGMCVHPDGNGYWFTDMCGRVVSAGSAPWQGDLYGNDLTNVVDIAASPNGYGYWLLRNDGTVNSYGSTAYYGDSVHSATLPDGSPAIAKSIESHPTIQGYWVLWSDGYITAHNLPHYGNADDRTGFALGEWNTAIRRTSTGGGYWVTSSLGRVQAKGDAKHKGNAGISGYVAKRWYQGVCWDILTSSEEGDKGYAVQSADGNLWVCGVFHLFGSIGSGRVQQRFDGNYKDYCLDVETEILTATGWKNCETLQVGDSVLGFDPQTEQSCWQPVESVYRRDCVGREMVRMQGASFDALTTPDHRWLTRIEGNDDRWRWTTSDALRTTDKIPMNIPSTGTHVPLVPAHKDEFVELVGWFWTEGWWTSHSGNLAQSERKNPEKVDEIRRVLRTLYGEPGEIARGRSRGIGAQWREKVRADGVVIFILTKPIGDSLRAVMSEEKAVSWEFLRTLTLDQLNLFIEASVDADGSRDEHGRAKCLSQTNFERIEAFEFACILAGRPVTRKKSPKHASWNVHLHTCGYQTPVRSQRARGRMTVTRELYTGTVWCPTVEHGNFVARRNGSIYVTGNSDIVKELCLWAGFYLYRDPQPTDKFPDVYGNIETTGAYAENPLPKDMFDKRPIIEAIKALREIVGYLVYIDAEGGVRWESPNIWALGNFLSDVTGDQRTPFPYMPEIDETVQLVSHSVTRSANQARSRIIIATQDPYPSLPGKDPPKGVVTTEIIPKTAADLKGLVVPAMWTNGKFLLPEEQQVMADLIDMRMWFSRRTANVSCVANPLIDINDQVRVIERQTGDVFIHYIRGVSFHHDLQSGDFQMDLTTHWLGGSQWGKDTLFYTGAMRPQGDGYWTATEGGSKNSNGTQAGIYGYGNAQVYDSHEADSHLEPIMAMRSTPSGDGYYSMDESGKVLSYGDAVNQGSVHRGMAIRDHNRRCGDASDLALTPSGLGYWIVQKDGTVTAFGDAVHMGDATPAGNLPDGAEIFAIGIESHPNTIGYWILMTDGSVEAHGLPDHGRASIDPGTKTGHATSLRRTASGNGYLICLGGGPVFAKGDASLQSLNTGYVVQDISAWYEGLFWDILVAPDDSYGLVRSNGEIVPYQFDLYPAGDVRPRQAYWAVVAPEDARTLGDPNAVFPVSPGIMGFLAGTGSPSANNAVVNNFGAPSTDAIVGSEQ